MSDYLIVIALCAMVSCAKYTPECEVVVRPLRSEALSNPYGSAAYMVRVYAYYLKDPHNWAPASYADAEAGIVRHKTTGEVRSQGLVAEQGSDTYVHLKISSSPVLFVAVDSFDKFYAYRSFVYEIPMPRVYIPVRFFLYKAVETSDYTWTDSAWTMISAQRDE